MHKIQNINLMNLFQHGDLLGFVLIASIFIAGDYQYDYVKYLNDTKLMDTLNYLPISIT